MGSNNQYTIYRVYCSFYYWYGSLSIDYRCRAPNFVKDFQFCTNFNCSTCCVLCPVNYINWNINLYDLGTVPNQCSVDQYEQPRVDSE